MAIRPLFWLQADHAPALTFQHSGASAAETMPIGKSPRNLSRGVGLKASESNFRQ
jgi:hypothetical protein